MYEFILVIFFVYLQFTIQKRTKYSETYNTVFELILTIYQYLSQMIMN